MFVLLVVVFVIVREEFKVEVKVIFVVFVGNGNCNGLGNVFVNLNFNFFLDWIGDVNVNCFGNFVYDCFINGNFVSFGMLLRNVFGVVYFFFVKDLFIDGCVDYFLMFNMFIVYYGVYVSLMFWFVDCCYVCVFVGNYVWVGYYVWDFICYDVGNLNLVVYGFCRWWVVDIFVVGVRCILRSVIVVLGVLL